MAKINLNLKTNGYPIIVTKGHCDLLAKILKQQNLGTDAIIITNSKIKKFYASRLILTLEENGINCHTFIVPDTEKSKSIKEYIKVINKISSLDKKKRLFLVAFGGGVIGDLTGFVAATYKRGVPYIQIPTTLLAQVDSAIGGKTALDLPSGKNLVGAFYQPKLVFSNINLIGSLPKKQISSGLAEVVKYGIIIDHKLFKYLENNTKKILKLNSDCLLKIITESSKIKARIVEHDEKETTGLRTILNFGHTIGHALEAAAGYSKLTHGEAISIGMVCAAEISYKMGIINEKDLKRIIDLLTAFKLPVYAKKLKMNKVLEAFSRDKKFINGQIRMVIPSRIGHVFVTENIEYKLIKQVIKKRIL